MMEISCFVEPAKVPLPATSITPFFQVTPSTSRPLQPCSFIPHSKPLLPFDSSQPGPAVIPQPAFLLPSLPGFLRSPRDGRSPGRRDAGAARGSERCSRRGWRERIPPGHIARDAAGHAATGKRTGSQLWGYKASCGLAGSYESAPPNGGGGRHFRHVNFAARDLGICSFPPACRWYLSQPTFSLEETGKRN